MGTFPSVLIGQPFGQGDNTESNNEINTSMNTDNHSNVHRIDSESNNDIKTPINASYSSAQASQNHSGHILAGGGLIIKNEAQLDKKAKFELCNDPRQGSNQNPTVANISNYQQSIEDPLTLNCSYKEFIEPTKTFQIYLSEKLEEDIKNNQIHKNTPPSRSNQNQPTNPDSIKRDNHLNQTVNHKITGFKPPLFRFNKREDNHVITKSMINKNEENAPIGFSFSPAGLLIPYHFGVTSYLLETGILSEHSPIAGASSGSLACIANISNLNLIDCLGLVNSICMKAKEKGTAGRLQEFLNSALEEILPDNIHEYVNKRPGSVTIAVTEVFPFKGKFINHFFSRDDVIECLMASCNIPFYFSNWPLVSFRGKHCVDGFFAVPRTEVGCPPTQSLRKIKIVPFNTNKINSGTSDNDWITPDLSIKDEEILDYLERLNLIQNKSWFEVSSGFYISSMNSNSNNDNTIQYDKDHESVPLNPKVPPSSVLALLGIFPPKAFSYQFMAAPKLIKNRWQWNQILRIALEGAEEPIIQELYDMGRIDCFRWLICEYINLDKLLMGNWDIIWGLLINQIENFKSHLDSNDNLTCNFESTSPKSNKSLNTEQMKILATKIVQKLIEANLIEPQFEHILSHNHRSMIVSNQYY